MTVDPLEHRKDNITESPESPVEAVARIIARDVGRRGSAMLHCAGDMEAAAGAVLQSSRIAVATGFYVAAAGGCETDGALGALLLASELPRLGVAVTIVSDRYSLPTIAGAVEQLGLPVTLLQYPEPAVDAFDCWIALERVGPARDGRYYSMSGEPVEDCNEPLETLFIQARGAGIPTIGIGDGGNEIGMGKVYDRVCRYVPHGKRIACTVATDYLIACGISNWGAWGLLAALSLRTSTILLPPEAQEEHILEALVARGAADGITGLRAATVDGVPWREQLAVRREIETIIIIASNSSATGGRSDG